MRVLVLAPDPKKLGGISIYLQSLKPFFSKDVEYFVIGRRVRENSDWDAMDKSRLYLLLRLFQDYIKFVIHLIKNKYDVLHLNPSLNSKLILRDGLYILTARLFIANYIVFFRGWEKEFEQKLRQRYLPLFRFVYFRASALTVLANDFKNSLEEMGYSGTIHLETTSYNEDFNEKTSDSSRKNRNEKEPYTILFLSRIEVAKGVYVAVKAFNLFKKKFPNSKLVIAGSGYELEHLKEHVAQNGFSGIEILGPIYGEPKFEAFNNANVYLFPTWHPEGMPGTVNEAMAAGLPIITRPVGGLKDFFINGEMGYMTESKDPKDFAALLEKLHQDPEQAGKIGAGNRAYARNRFSASKVAERIEKIYRDIVNPSGSDRA